jgi:GNAT superfamily N-acetyltransferase
MDPALRIMPFAPEDEQDLFAAYAAAVAEGGAFPRHPPATPEMFHGAWLEGAATVQVARLEGRLAGSYFLKPNFPGTAAHIANAGYLVSAAMRRRGIGRALAEHSLNEARLRGFDALMFNLVLETNPSRKLWLSLGFVEVGRIPNAVEGVAAVMYWRAL